MGYGEKDRETRFVSRESEMGREKEEEFSFEKIEYSFVHRRFNTFFLGRRITKNSDSSWV